MHEPGANQSSDERMRRTGRQSQQQCKEIPKDRTAERRGDDSLCHRRRIDNPRSHHLGHGRGHKGPRYIENAGHHHGKERTQDTSRHHSGNRVRTVVPSIRKVEQQRQDDDEQEHTAKLWNHATIDESDAVGCSKRSANKAAGKSKPEAYPLGYVEDFGDPKTQLEVFFSSLYMLEGNTFQDIRHIFTAVGSFFEVFINLFPLDHGNGVFLVFEQIGNRIARDAIRFVF